MILIAAIIAIALSHSITGISGLRTLGWYTRYVEFLNARLGGWRLWDSPLALAVIVGPPILAVALAQAYLDGLPGFALAVMVLVYAWGSRDLDQDVDAYLDATERSDTATARSYARHLLGSGTGGTPDEAALVGGIMDESLRRWFGVLLWFCLFGATGAALFRLVQKLAEGIELGQQLPQALRESAVLLYRALAWPAAVLVTLGLALAANFDVVMHTWRAWYRRQDQQFFNLNPGFVGAVGAATVQALQSDQDADEYADAGPTWAVRCTMRLLWRTLVAWLTVLALLTLAGLAR